MSYRKIAGVVEKVKGDKFSSVATRYGDRGHDPTLYLASKRSGLTLIEIGDVAGGVSPGTVTQAVCRIRNQNR